MALYSFSQALELYDNEGKLFAEDCTLSTPLCLWNYMREELYKKNCIHLVENIWTRWEDYNNYEQYTKTKPNSIEEEFNCFVL